MLRHDRRSREGVGPGALRIENITLMQSLTTTVTNPIPAPWGRRIMIMDQYPTFGICIEYLLPHLQAFGALRSVVMYTEPWPFVVADFVDADAAAAAQRGMHNHYLFAGQLDPLTVEFTVWAPPVQFVSFPVESTPVEVKDPPKVTTPASPSPPPPSPLKLPAAARPFDEKRVEQHTKPSVASDVLATAATAAASTGTLVVAHNLAAAEPLERICSLFGVFGNVLHARAFGTQGESALVEFASAEQAKRAALHLDGLQWNGRELRVHVADRIPRVTPHESVVSPMASQWRFAAPRGATERKASVPPPRGATFLSILTEAAQTFVPPTTHLALRGLPATVQRDVLAKWLRNAVGVASCSLTGIARTSVDGKNHTTATLETGNLSDAITTLVRLHGTVMDGHRLYVDFVPHRGGAGSKSTSSSPPVG